VDGDEEVAGEKYGCNFSLGKLCITMAIYRNWSRMQMNNILNPIMMRIRMTTKMVVVVIL
jgi:hypothetical protein